MNPEPFRIEPTFSPRLWGSQSLAPLFPDKVNLSEPIGEAWLSDVNCRISTGSFSGISLKDAWREMPVEWRGTKFAQAGEFPLLTKFIFPTDKLSIQVHPDDAYAAAHEQAAGGRGKTEMWHIVSGKPDASLLLGLKQGTSKEAFLAGLKAHKLENFFQRHFVAPGDTFFVPPGIQHTIGANMVVFEAQEYSDLTYRVYDYNRRDAQGKSRELHIEKALEVIRFGQSASPKVDPVQIQRGALTETYFVACRYFATEKWEFAERISAATDREHFDLLIFLAGHGTILWGNESLEYAPAQAWLIPAALGAYQLIPAAQTSLLRTYVPTHVEDFARELADHGIAKDAYSRLVHP